MSYPEIPANYCATTYPVKEVLIKGKDSIVTDTLYGEGEIIRDTINSRDTVFIYNTVRLPGSVINKTVYKTDTIKKEGGALFALCSIERSKLISLLQDKSQQVETLKKKAKKRFWTIAAMGSVILLFFFYRLKKRFYDKRI